MASLASASVIGQFLGAKGEGAKFSYLLANLGGILGEGDCGEPFFEAFALSLFHLLEFFG